MQIILSANGSLVIPPGITTAQVELWGAGGGGGGSANTTFGGAGGGGGAYLSANLTGLVSGNSYAFNIGAGGAGGANNANGSNGGATLFNNNSGGNTSTMLSAAAGLLGTWGSGNAQEVGGNGGAANTATGVTSFAGNNGANGVAAAGGAGGASLGTGGGVGGAGGAGANNGANGTAPGGGGGGAGNNGPVGGTGANGQMRITLPNQYIGDAPWQNLAGQRLRKVKIPLAGLTANGNNTIIHQIPRTPFEVIYVPSGAGGGWSEWKAADATNIYLTIASGGSVSGWAYCLY